MSDEQPRRRRGDSKPDWRWLIPVLAALLGGGGGQLLTTPWPTRDEMQAAHRKLVREIRKARCVSTPDEVEDDETEGEQ
jgi:hypothetical protein